MQSLAVSGEPRTSPSLSPADIPGSVGEFFAANPSVGLAAIDRFQEWDFPNYTPSAAVLGYVPRWYNFRRAQQDQLDAQQGVTEVVLLDHEPFVPDGPAGPDGPFANAFNNSIWPAEFPDAATMAGFDTMEVVVNGVCGPSPADDCGHWDY